MIQYGGPNGQHTVDVRLNIMVDEDFMNDRYYFSEIVKILNLSDLDCSRTAGCVGWCGYKKSEGGVVW